MLGTVIWCPQKSFCLHCVQYVMLLGQGSITTKITTISQLQMPAPSNLCRTWVESKFHLLNWVKSIQILCFQRDKLVKWLNNKGKGKSLLQSCTYTGRSSKYDLLGPSWHTCKVKPHIVKYISNAKMWI